MQVTGGMMNSDDGSKTRTACCIPLLAVIAVAALLWVLRETAVITVPLIFALFLTLLVVPLYEWLRQHLPRYFKFLSIFAVAAVIIIGGALVFAAFWFSIGRAIEGIPDYAERLESQWYNLRDWAASHGFYIDRQPVEDRSLKNGVMTFATGIIRSATSGLSFLAMVFFFMLLMLVEQAVWRRRMETFFPQERSEQVLQTLHQIAKKFRRYFFATTFIAVISAVTQGSWLWVTGLDLFLMWTLLFFLLSYLPTIGSILAVIPPAVLAFIQFGPGKALMVLGGMIVLEQLIGNLLAPRIEGRALLISPVLLLASIIFWGAFWGIAGAFLAVPLTAAFIVAAEHVPTLRPFAKLASRSKSD